MTPQKQAFRHTPESGVYGDCHRTAIACILDLDRDDVPNFAEHWDDPDSWEAVEVAWLRSRGYEKVSIAYGPEIVNHPQAFNPHAYYLLGGTSRNGTGHTVIGLGGKVAWDPSLDDSGIVGPMEDGYYWVTYLIPAALCAPVTGVVP